METPQRQQPPPPRKPVIHILKTWPMYFAAVVSGKKNFEIRKYDRDFRLGDMLSLAEYLPAEFDQPGEFTGSCATRIIEYIFVGSGEFGIEIGYCILGIRPLTRYDAIPEQIASFDAAEAKQFNEAHLGAEDGPQ